jgi:hypothetical protein
MKFSKTSIQIRSDLQPNMIHIEKVFNSLADAQQQSVTAHQVSYSPNPQLAESFTPSFYTQSTNRNNNGV